MQQKLIEFEAIGVAKVVDPVIDASSTPDICVAFSQRDRGHPIPHVKPERIKTVVIFCDKGRYVPILENSTGTDLGNGSKTEVCLGRDLFTSLESVYNPFPHHTPLSFQSCNVIYRKPSV